MHAIAAAPSSRINRKVTAHLLAWLAASGFARAQRTAFCPLKKTTRPALPALGHSGNRNQPIGFMAITSVDAEYISNGEIMIGSLDYPDLISGTHITLDDDS